MPRPQRAGVAPVAPTISVPDLPRLGASFDMQVEIANPQAIELDGDDPAPHRELGLLLRDRQDFRGACVQLRRYAKLDPEAEDMEHIDELIAEMTRNGECG